MGTGCLVMTIQDMAHQQPHGPGNAVRIAQQFRLVGKRHFRLLVIQQAVNQGNNHIRRKSALVHEIMKTGIGRIRPGATGQEIGANDLKTRGACRDITISHIIKNPAKGIEPGGIIPHALAQKAPRPMETPAIRGK